MRGHRHRKIDLLELEGVLARCRGRQTRCQLIHFGLQIVDRVVQRMDLGVD